ncbi:hypothetical protein [Okeania sp.]|uniref:hypothetical protein n=1 Tax=Okeania sp. TaxID=3100323 RepID=UPI002B4B0A24|nr:hypothetical protein [Okeania sp.]MEB3343021.1 hypothetical protein [Okeania sp.]
MNYHKNKNFQENSEPNYDSASSSFNSLDNVKKSIKVFFADFLAWFKTLPQWGKIAGLIIIPIFLIKILEAFVSLVSLLITIVIFGGVIYFGYRFFIPPNYSEKDK